MKHEQMKAVPGRSAAGLSGAGLSGAGLSGHRARMNDAVGTLRRRARLEVCADEEPLEEELIEEPMEEAPREEDAEALIAEEIPDEMTSEMPDESAAEQGTAAASAVNDPPQIAPDPAVTAETAQDEREAEEEQEDALRGALSAGGPEGSAVEDALLRGGIPALEPVRGGVDCAPREAVYLPGDGTPRPIELPPVLTRRLYPHGVSGQGTARPAIGEDPQPEPEPDPEE